MIKNQMIQVFENEEFGKVRAMSIDGEPWFVASDVCTALGVGNNRQAITRLDDDEKGVISNDTLGGKQEMNIVNEPGFYSLVLSSRKPGAKQFKRWVTHDVIPAIRKTGGYIMGEEGMSEDELVLKAMEVMQAKVNRLHAENLRLESENKIMAPKASYCDMVLKAPNAVPISCIAKDYGMSAKAMNQKLKELGIQYRCGKMWLLRSQYQDKGYTKSETYVVKSTGDAFMNTKWTQEGRLFLYYELKKVGILPLMEK